MVLVDSYPETNCSIAFNLRILHPSSVAANSGGGQSFNSDDVYKITSAKFYLKKVGSPTGNAHAVLYAHTGVFGTSSVPTGSPLATSDNFDVSTLTTGYQLITFTFTGAQQYEMQSGVKYCIVFENPTSGTVNASHYTVQCADNTSPSHAGNSMRYNNSAWHSSNSYDVCFYVYGDLVSGDVSAGIKIWDGTADIELVKDDTSPVKIYTGAAVIGVKLVATGHADASAIRIFDGVATKAFKKKV